MTFRILTLDGGGAWALIEVHALINLYGEDAKGNDVLKKFDLVAANSGGALVLAALVENLTLKEILQYFLSEQNRRALFSPTTMVIDKALSDLLGFGPTHSTAAKLQAIRSLLPHTGDKPLVGIAKDIIGPGGAPVHLLIIGFDYDRNHATFFRSAQASGPSWGEGQPSTVSLAGAAHASSTAPVKLFRRAGASALDYEPLLGRRGVRLQQSGARRRHRGQSAGDNTGGYTSSRSRHGNRGPASCGAGPARRTTRGTARRL